MQPLSGLVRISGDLDPGSDIPMQNAECGVRSWQGAGSKRTGERTARAGFHGFRCFVAVGIKLCHLHGHEDWRQCLITIPLN